MAAPTAVPVTIVTGFLGSGKTTIISKVIDQLSPSESQIVYVKNEFGSEDIDAQLLKGKHIQTRELLNGCICCTLVGPFLAAVNEIISTFKPPRIIIEASGSADPSAIALMVSSHPQLIRDGVIAVIDVLNFEGYHDLSQTARNQARFTDLIIFNKVEAADLAQKQRVVGYVRELNDFAPIIEAPQGRVTPAVVFGVSTNTLTSILEPQANHTHLEHDQLSTSTIEFRQPLSRFVLEKWLASLPKAVIRVKGVVTDETHQPVLVNKVGPRSSLTPLNDTTITSRKLVLIGFELENLGIDWLASLEAISDSEHLSRS